MLQLIDEKGQTPNVLHFHGQNIHELPRTFETIYNKYQVDTDYNRDQLAIVSTWTDDEKCCLLQQCRRFDIPLINCVPDDYDRTQTWYMPNKIIFFIETLKKLKQEYVLFLDGYDVLLTGLNNIIERFVTQPYHILFGPSCNNYPDVRVDRLHNRHKMGIYRYFNAGCVLGHREDLIKFYEQSLEYLNIENTWNSEQYILRQVFAKYSSDPNQDFVGIDHQSLIFRSMGVTDSNINGDTITIQPNRQVTPHILKLGIVGKTDKTTICLSPIQVNYITDIYNFINEYIKYDDNINEIIVYDVSDVKKKKIKKLCERWGIDYSENKKEEP